MSSLPVASNQIPDKQADENQKQRDWEAVCLNFSSLRNILDDISGRLSHQVLGNCDVLEKTDLKANGFTPIAEQKSTSLQPEIQAFRTEQINTLIRQPVKLTLGRLNGLKKVLDKIKDQMEAFSPAVEKVSSGNSD